MAESSIYFWISDDCGWIRVVGDANRLNAGQVGQVRSFVSETLANERARRFAVDLAECTRLGETFVGTRAGMALWFQERGKKRMRIVRAKRHEKYVRDLGLEQLLVIDSGQ